MSHIILKKNWEYISILVNRGIWRKSGTVVTGGSTNTFSGFNIIIVSRPESIYFHK